MALRPGRRKKRNNLFVVGAGSADVVDDVDAFADVDGFCGTGPAEPLTDAGITTISDVAAGDESDALDVDASDMRAGDERMSSLAAANSNSDSI